MSAFLSVEITRFRKSTKNFSASSRPPLVPASLSSENIGEKYDHGYLTAATVCCSAAGKRSFLVSWSSFVMRLLLAFLMLFPPNPNTAI
jgi:hypothetical protein